MELQSTESIKSQSSQMDSMRSPHHSREVEGRRSGQKQIQPNQNAAATGGRVKKFSEEVSKHSGNRENSDWNHF